MLIVHPEESGDMISVYETLGDCAKQIKKKKKEKKRNCARALTIFTQHLKAACVGLYCKEMSGCQKLSNC